MSKGNYIAIAAVIAAAILYYIYKQGKKAGGIIPLPNNGSGIPENWSAVASVKIIREAFNPSGSAWLMSVDGTNEGAIFDTLNGLTDDQLAAVYNQYKHETGMDLLDVFIMELSGDDLTKATSYFSFLNRQFSLSNLRSNLF